MAAPTPGGATEAGTNPASENTRMDTLVWLLHLPVTRGAINGVVAAAAVDVHAFLSWRDMHEFATYNWGTAALRWVQGAVIGAVTGAGYQALLGL